MQNRSANNTASKVMKAGLFGVALGSFEFLNAIHDGEFSASIPRAVTSGLIYSALSFMSNNNAACISAISVAYSVLTFNWSPAALGHGVIVGAGAALINSLLPEEALSRAEVQPAAMVSNRR